MRSEKDASLYREPCLVAAAVEYHAGPRRFDRGDTVERGVFDAAVMCIGSYAPHLPPAFPIVYNISLLLASVVSCNTLSCF